MHISKVDIRNIRSYRNLTVVEFHEGHNVIVGHNGAGKSNLFLAIRLVLCGEPFPVSERERKVLLHNDGIGPNTVGYVEVVFNNADSRIPIIGPEVKIRHTITVTGSRFTINGKEAKRAHVLSLWETTGISTRNPYFCVSQGAICKVVQASSRKRLSMLQDIIGVTMHREKVISTEVGLQKIEKMQAYIDTITAEFQERYQQIQQQAVEVKQLEDLEARIATIEFLMCTQENAQAERAFDKAEKSWHECQRQFKDMAETCGQLKGRCKGMEKKLSDLECTENLLAELIKTAYARQRSLTADCTKVDFEQKRLRKELEDERAARARVTAKLRQFEESSAAEMQKAERCEELAANVKNIENQITLKKLQFEELSRKKNHVDESEQERNTRISGGIRKLQAHLGQIAARESDLNSEIETISGTIEELEAALNNDREELTEVSKKIVEHEGLLKSMIGELDGLVSELRACDEQEFQISAGHKRAVETLRAAEHMFFKRDYKTYREILTLVEDICKQTKESVADHYHGLVIEKFTCPEELYPVVDIIGNKKLFNHVIETDTFATRLTGAFNKKRVTGSLNMLALNRLWYKDVDVSNIDPARAKPLISYLRFDPKYEPLMKYIFGNALICESEDQFDEYAKKHRFNCVTLEGTHCNPRGALTGGYYNPKRSAPHLQAERQKLQAEVSSLQQELDKLQQSRAEKESKKLVLTDSKCKLHCQVDITKRSCCSLRLEVQRKMNDLAAMKQSREFHIPKLQDVQSEAAVIKEEICYLEQELCKDWVPQFSPEEEAQLKQLMEEIAALRRSAVGLVEQNQELSKWREKRALILKIRERELQLDVGDDGEKVQELRHLKVRAEKLERDLTSIQESLIEAEENQQSVQEEVSRYSEALQEKKERHLKSKEARNAIEVEKHKWLWEMEKNSEKISKIAAQILSLGCLRQRLIDHYQPFSKAQLQRERAVLKVQCQQFRAVNRNALSEYRLLKDKLDELQKQSHSLRNVIEDVNDMVGNTMRNKEAAINITYEQVTRHFSEIFSRLVPVGRGKLMLRPDAPRHRSFGRRTSTSTSESNESATYTGIDLLVSFSGNDSQERRMEHLSGGQRSLTALAFIFAIQTFDRVPFYLFDEIDAHLDPMSRAHVAELIRDYAANTQIITTSFRPEILRSANRCFQVYYHNRASGVKVVTQEEAAGIISMESPQSVGSGFAVRY